ncbi:mannose-6-phosphate isomerase [Natronobacillus azotifigens]|uniref:Mannose-6-phosphate isomerase n=1 Tax=Natronobacillus azotifigens TaxID=472978 RepID=A0A9J6RC29_9BACI|nr:mannose-6-phosphate isomerase, class I [Natronobacillus azotifigens]MCZ0703103.1 mannose-6-phosphate isomerase, class I [Natronobacillus azotifigens]
MYSEPIFLEPEFKQRIWGGTKLRDYFDYNIPSNITGECWGISAHKNGPSTLKNGPLKGKKLNDVWRENRELFANEQGDTFPLLVKILDANDDLSVQVHPDDEYANQHEHGDLGKTECWYVIDCEVDSHLIVGHHAKTKEEFIAKVESGHWDSLLRKIAIKPGDFFYVPSGTIHAIGKGALILETQQSSDTTYRVYDYDRTDKEGNKRELHVKKSIDVSTIPHVEPNLEQKVIKQEGLVYKMLVSEKYFTVYHYSLAGSVKMNRDYRYLLMSVFKGNGSVIIEGKEFPFCKGDHFIIPSTINEFELNGETELIVSHTTA